MLVDFGLRRKLRVSHTNRMPLSWLLRLPFDILISFHVGGLIVEHLAPFTSLLRTYTATRVREFPAHCGLAKGSAVMNSTSIE